MKPSRRWHWGICMCGQPHYVDEGDMKRGHVGAVGECCGATAENFGQDIDAACAHPATHYAGRCHVCELRANGKDVRPIVTKAGEQESPMNGKKKKAKKGQPNGHNVRPLHKPAPPAPDGEERIEKKRHHQELPCIVNATERGKHATELAKIVRERLALAERKRNVLAQFKKQREFYDEQEERLSAAVDGGIEKRSVECVDFLLPRTNEVITIRLDTNEEIDRRTASAEELQEDMFPAADDEEAGEEEEEEDDGIVDDGPLEEGA